MTYSKMLLIFVGEDLFGDDLDCKRFQSSTEGEPIVSSGGLGGDAEEVVGSSPEVG